MSFSPLLKSREMSKATISISTAPYPLYIREASSPRSRAETSPIGFLREHVSMNHLVVYSSNSYAYCSGFISSLRSRMLHFFLIIIIIVDVIVLLFLLLSLIHTQTHPSDCCWLGIVAIGRGTCECRAGKSVVFLCFVHSSCWCYILYCPYTLECVSNFH